jgi:hypothetical protein
LAGCLPFQTQGIDNGPVAVDIFEFDVIEQPAASANQHQQPSAGMMIFLVNLQMFGKVGNAVGQKAYLHFWRSRIGLVQFEFFDQYLLILCCKSHFFFASSGYLNFLPEFNEQHSGYCS